MDIDTVLFDLDGTLINTNELIIASFLDTLKRYAPGRYGREDIVEWIGEPLRESFVRVDPERADEMVEAYRKHNLEHHDRFVEEYPGVFDTIRILHEQGMKLAVVTTKRRKTAEMGLKIGRLSPFFDVIVPLDEVSKAKPDPEPIHRALELLDSISEKTMMVGDSPSDIQAGKNAGTYTAGVAWAIKGADVLRALAPDVMLETMPDLLNVLGVKVG
jgi:pyrophosphatase PpaX